MARRIGVVGAGLIGLAVARELQRGAGDAVVTVLEKETAVARHQSGHNSGVAHAGLYYAPGSLKAQLCRRGIGLLKQYSEQHGIAYEECGKLVIARDEVELGRLDEIERRARENGVPGLRRLAAEQIAEVEPAAVGVAALHSPQTAIVDFPAVARRLAADVEDVGGSVRLGFEVAQIERAKRAVTVRGRSGEALAFDWLVLCAGLQSDRLARRAGGGREPAIVPFRGEYYELVDERRDLIRGLIYPVPDPAYPFLGVHFTRRVDGGVDIGPNAVLALAREGYRWRKLSPRDTWDTLSWVGFRRLARRHWRMGVREIHGSLSRGAFVAQAREFVPALSNRDVRRAGAGVRAQALDADGSLVDDFRIVRLGRVVAVRNAPSPGATSSLAIAEHIATHVGAPVRRRAPGAAVRTGERGRAGRGAGPARAAGPHDGRGSGAGSVSDRGGL